MGLFRRNKPDSKPPQPTPSAKPAEPQKPSPTPPAATPAQPVAQTKPAASAPAAQKPAGPATVTMVDAFGRTQQIPREQWKKEVLPQAIDAYQHAPDKLAALLLQYMRDGLSDDLLPAALRLAALDKDVERGLSILAAVQRDVGEYDSAQATLRELQQKLPESLSPLVGLAMIADRQGDRSSATALLWGALQKDGNHPDALHGWLQWEHQRLGDDAYPKALEEACALPGSWRPQLWRARHLLQKGQKDAAMTDYRHVAEKAGDESDALFMMANDLGRAGLLDAVRELVLSRYRLEAHHPGIGVTLLNYYAATKQPKEGMDLLHRLRVRFPRVFDQQLAPFDAEFTRQLVPPAAPLTGQPKVIVFRMDRPLWYGVLGKPEFLLPPPQREGLVLFAGLAVIQDANKQAQVQREDELGRLSRSVPLFLAEQLHLLAGIQCGSALPVVEGGGWVVSSAPWSEDRLTELLTDRERKDTKIVTGTVRPDGNQRRIDLWVYDTATKQRTGHATATGEEGKLGPVYLQLLREVSALVGGKPDLAPAVGSETFWEKYATAQAQLSALVIAAQGLLKKELVFGQRAILEWTLALALDERRSVQARMLLSCALAADAAMGSNVHKELAGPFAELFRVEPAASPFARTALPVLRALGLEPLWRHRRDEILAAGTDTFRQWVARVEGAAGSKA
jgi:tetratricopeptide (TPR) repeat protein